MGGAVTSGVRIRVMNHRACGSDWVDRLRAVGYDVDTRPLRTAADLRALGEEAPAVVVVDLVRAPSQGRDVGLGIRQQKSSRMIPLVFVDGRPDRLPALRALLPDAVCTSGDLVCSAVERAIATRLLDPVRPAAVLAGYSGTPLPRKLGITPGAVVRLVRAPTGFEATLGDLPVGARVRRRGDERDLTIWFVRRLSELERGIAATAARVTTDKLWIAWPKKTSALAGDVSAGKVRAAGIAHGLVDFKVCAIDRDWSGLCFARRRRR